VVFLQILRPDEYRESIFTIDLDQLKARGIRAIMLDLDNTLVRWNDPEPTAELVQWLARVEALGMAACIVSNNRGARVQRFAERIGIPFVPRAAKPSRRGFRLAMRQCNVDPHETAVVGDQIFTDILGGNRTGAYTILVVPLHTHEFVGTKVLRFLERRVLNRMRLQGLKID